MPITSTERLLNLVLALLGSRLGRSRDFVRSSVAGYSPDASDEAFGRMFERDKAQLKRLGIPIKTVEDPQGDERNAWKYRIDPAEYRLPEIPLDPQGAALLALAARVWEQASLGSAAASALRKVETVAGLDSPQGPPAVESRIRTKEPAFDALWDALLNHHPVSFDYRPAGAAEATGRTVLPWGLGNKYGQWYLDGFDTAKNEQRLFRLSRISGAVVPGSAVFTPPADYDIAAALDRLGTGTPLSGVVEVPAGKAWLLREQATASGPSPREGWDTLTVPYREAEMFAAELAALGPAVLVLSPPELRADVIRRLQRARDLDAGPAAAVERGTVAPARPPKETTEDRLRRLLDLVPYVVRNSGIAFDDVAAEFAVSPAQLTKDLELLSVCGLPGYLHGDLIDVQWDEGPVWIRDAETLKSPLRLTQAEACALLVGLEALQALPDAAAREALDKVLDDVRKVAGPDAWVADVVEARITEEASLELLSLLQQATATSGLVRIKYLVPLRDELTDRVIEPRRIFSVDAQWYVEAYCRRAQGMRNFRLDHIRTAEAVPGSAPGRPVPATDTGPEALFTPGERDQEVVLALTGDVAWVADAYAGTSRTELADGRTAVRIRFATAAAIPSLLTRLGGSVQLLEPAGLRGATARWAAEALAGYGQAAGATP